MMARLRGACVGAGYFSQFHIDGWARIPEVEIVAVCDADAARAEAAGARCGTARAYADFADDAPCRAARLRRRHHAAADPRGTVPGRGRIAARTSSARSRWRRRSDQARRIVEACRRGRRTVHGPRELPVPALAPGDQAAARRGGHRDEAALADVPLAPGRRLGPRRLPRPATLFPDHAPAPGLRDGRPLHRHVPLPGGRGRADVTPSSAGSTRPSPARIAACSSSSSPAGRSACGTRTATTSRTAADPRYTFGEFLVEGDGGSLRLAPDGTLTIQPLGQPRAPPRLPTRAARIRRQLRVRHAATFRRPADRRWRVRDRRPRVSQDPGRAGGRLRVGPPPDARRGSAGRRAGRGCRAPGRGPGDAEVTQSERLNGGVKVRRPAGE